jgi:hypothetical protein
MVVCPIPEKLYFDLSTVIILTLFLFFIFAETLSFLNVYVNFASPLPRDRPLIFKV